MSKSKGNVIDPIILSQKYSPDAIRYFLMREMGYGLDCNYSEDVLALRINTDLANDYGNLLSRVTGMAEKFQGGQILPPGESTEFDTELIELAKAVPARFEALMDGMRWADALAELWKLVNKANKYIDDTAPWALNKADETGKLASVLYNIAEVTRLVTVMVSPVMPSIPAKVWEQLGIADKPELQGWDSLGWGGLPGNAKVTHGAPLFPRIDLKSLDDIPLNPVEEQKVDKQKAAAPPMLPEITIDQFATMDMRVVKVLACEQVPKTDKLLKFTVQMGDEERIIISGIAKHYQPEQLIGRNLIAIANLQPVKIRGIESRGMLLSAVNDEKGALELLEVPSMESGIRVR